MDTDHGGRPGWRGGIRRGPRGALRSIASFTIVGEEIVEIFVLADPARLAQLDLAAQGD